MVVSAIITGRQHVFTSCHQGSQQFITKGWQGRPQDSLGITKVITWLWKVVRWERILEKSSLVITCRHLSSVLLATNFHVTKLPVSQYPTKILKNLDIKKSWFWKNLDRLHKVKKYGNRDYPEFRTARFARKSAMWPIGLGMVLYRMVQYCTIISTLHTQFKTQVHDTSCYFNIAWFSLNSSPQ